MPLSPRLRAVVIASLNQPSSRGTAYTISGYAYDADGSTGVVGATVALGAYSGVSGAGGAYTITGIPPGTSGPMTCTKTGYSWGTKTIASMSANLTSQNYTAYVLKDEFTTTEAAPIASPRTCEPGPGTLTKTDASNVLSISGGLLSWAGGGTATIASASQTRATGLALMVYVTTPGGGTRYCLLGTQLAVGQTIGYWDTGSTISQINPNSKTLYVIMRSAGAFVIVDNKLAYVDYTGTGNSVASLNSNALMTTAFFRIAKLPAPFASDYGIATGYTASPASGATLTHTADGLMGVTWTAATGATLELDVRMTDADNRWIVRCDQAGSTIKLIERNAGVETERSSAAQTWTNGTSYRINVTCTGNSIYTFVANTSKNSYTSASFNNTATTARITPSAGAIANFATFPETLSGSALTVLQEFAP